MNEARKMDVTCAQLLVQRAQLDAVIDELARALRQAFGNMTSDLFYCWTSGPDVLTGCGRGHGGQLACQNGVRVRPRRGCHDTRERRIPVPSMRNEAATKCKKPKKYQRVYILMYYCT